MKIDLLAITSGEKLFVEEWYSPVKLDLNNQDIEFLEDIFFRGEALRGDGFLQIEGEVTSRWKEVCARCLRRTEKDFKSSIHLDLAVGNSETIYDFTPELREEILTAYPDRILCSDTCRGLCGNCGANLNVAPCDCAGQDDEKSPFSILNKMKEEKE